MANESSAPIAAGLSTADLGKLILRLAIGGLMLFHGIAKMEHGVSQLADMVSARGLPGFLAYGSYVGEGLAPLLVIFGLLTRPAALIITFQMIMAIYIAHMKDLGSISQTGGWAVELPMLYLLGALAIAFLGAGKLSVTRGKGRWN